MLLQERKWIVKQTRAAEDLIAERQEKSKQQQSRGGRQRGRASKGAWDAQLNSVPPLRRRRLRNATWGLHWHRSWADVDPRCRSLVCGVALRLDSLRGARMGA